MDRHVASLLDRGVAAFERSDFATAATSFGEALIFGEDARVWLHIADTQRALGDVDGMCDALHAALRIEPDNTAAATRLAMHYDAVARSDLAVPHWITASSGAADPADDAHARRKVTQARAAFATHVDDLLASRRADHAPADLRRFDACIDNLLGRGEAGARHVPGLPQQEFYDRAQIPWLDRLEAHAVEIRRELVALLAAPEPGLVPFVAMPPGTGEPEWSHLDRSLDWAAFHFWRHGERIDDAAARCPVTAGLLDTLPMMRLPGRTPNVSFAILRPGARLPPHVGTSNIRAVVHLALVVPDGCALRVGTETRAWQEGRAFAFDDTVEHEAWNDSDAPRAILIVDAWNPHLTAIERDLLELFAAGTFSGARDMRALAL